MLETADGRLERRVTLSREQQAILRCQQGNLTGLEALFELHRQGVLRTAYGIVGKRALAEDVTQQVFVELFTALKRFDCGRPFAPWLYRIVVNISLKELRRQRPALSLEEETLDLTSPEPMPDQTAEEAELRRSMWAAIGSLKPKHRAAVVLRYYRGFSEAEMAVALGCPRGTVKSRLHSALQQLEEILRESGTQEDVPRRSQDATASSDAVQP